MGRISKRLLLRKNRSSLSTKASLGLAIFVGTADSGRSQESWPNWRGPNGNGVSLTATPPTHWDATDVVWKSPITGEGSSTPIVWDNQIFVLSALKIEKNDPSADATPMRVNRDNSFGEDWERPSMRGLTRSLSVDPDRPGVREGFRDDRSGGKRSNPRPSDLYQFLVSSFDLSTGARNWQVTVAEEVPHEGGHETNNFASCSPLTDGKNIFVCWGSRGIFCLDMKGTLVWSVDLGLKITSWQFGEGASAAYHKGVLIVPWDHEADSYLFALNAVNGDLNWKISRPEQTHWATPVITEVDGQAQVIVNGRRVRSYDLTDGSLLWECAGQTENTVPTPVIHNGNAIVMSGYRNNACYSISLLSRGNVSDNPKFIRWQYNHNAPYVPSPTLYRDNLFFLNENQNFLTCLNASTGKPVYAIERIEGLGVIYASLGAADGHVYVVDRSGKTAVINADENGKVIAINDLTDDELFDASPVFVNDRILLRSNNHLYCIGKKERASTE